MPKLKFRRQRAIKLRFRRHLRLQKRQVEEFGAQAEQRLEDDFFKRLERLAHVRRFVTSWLLLVVLLIGVVVAQTRSLNGHYQALAAAPGGTYVEGILGTFTNANPMYATDIVDTSVSELIFAGLLTYNQNNQLTGELAESWKADGSGTAYTVKLKPGLTWHDGKPLTAGDVVFTYQVIQNPDARSPLFGSWSGIAISALDDRTVLFKLPNPLASFPYSLTTGIVPKHILGGVPMANMRSVSFNSTQPVGAGPFQWQAIELSGGSADKRQEKIALKPFDDYYAGKPKLNGFVIRTFRDADKLVKSFQEQELTSIVGLTQVPDPLKDDGVLRAYNLPLTASVMTFFRTQDGVLADKRVRRALVQATDRQSIVDSLQYATRPVRQALQKGQLAYDQKYDQPTFSSAAAAQLLDEAGWTTGKEGLRYKDGAPLTFTLYLLDNPEYKSVASQLARQWRSAGADVKLMPQSESDFQGVLSSPDGSSGGYDALLYGISIGADPDVYVYWHSSQLDPRSPSRLNLSQYKSAAADASLEAGRTRLDPALRVAKYQPFLQSWQADAPALGLYQPRFLYLTRGAVYGLEEKFINADTGRFYNVHNWQIREEWSTSTE
ncbi:MAG TPA: ABC transporter substrate-binding protein [Candidatus Saccharimonadales bacterium]